MEKKDKITDALSEEELQREADEIRAMIDNEPELQDIHVTDEMHDRLMDRIQKYEQEKAISNLSEENQEALRLGIELQNRRKTRMSKKIWFVLAATLVLVVGVSVTSVGSKNIIIELFEKTFGDGDKTYVDSGESQEVGKITEEQAYVDIKKTFGDDVARLTYKPKSTKFLDMQLDKELQEAVLYYSVGENIMSFRMVSRYIESSIGMDIEDKLLQKYEIKLPETTVQISEYEIQETGELEYTAQFTYKNCEYVLVSIVEKEEFEKIIKNLHFF